MSSKDGSSWKASLRSGTTRSSPCSSDSSSTVWPEEEKEKQIKTSASRKPKRTSFTCLECSKTFPSQQAMAGHCSAHTRAGARTRHPNQRPAVPLFVTAPSNPPQLHQCRDVDAGHCWCPLVQGSSTNHMRPVAIRYVPYARPITNQMMVRLPYIELRHARSSVSPAAMDLTMNPELRPAPVHNMPTAQLGLGAFLPIYSVPPCSVNNNGAAPSDNVSSTNRPGQTRGDVTLRLGSGRNHAQKRTLPLIESLMVSDGHQGDGREGKRAVVMVDGGDQNGNSGEDPINGLDLELRLYR